jgi:hypothetical protein
VQAALIRRAEPGSIRGVVTGEDLARYLPRPRMDAVFRDVVAWDIDLSQAPVTRQACSADRQRKDSGA